MKILISVTFVLLTLVNICYSQSGWFTQYSNTTNHLRDLQFIDQQTGWSVGWSNTIRKTTNGGMTWFSQFSPSSQNHFQSCYFINSMTGWIGGGSQTGNISYIYKTTNGGENWIQQYYSNSGIIMRLSFSGSLYGCATGDGGKILMTTDGGQSWVQRVSGISTALTNVYLLNSSTGWIVGDYGVILKTTTGGVYWSPYYSGTTQNLEGVHFLNGLTGFVVGYNSVILKSTDGGQNWLSKLSGAKSYWPNSVFFLNDNTGWISGGKYGGIGQIIKTTNGGENWALQTIPSTSWLANIYFANAEKGWAVGSNGSIVSTIDGGLPIPNAPNLIFPPNNSINVPVNTTFSWSNVSSAQHYAFQISTLSNFSVITDSITVNTNLYSIPIGKLTYALTYFWRVKAFNSVGSSPWSSVWMFSTLTGINSISTVIPSEFKVYDAYPNPFNPTTKIKFDIPKATSMQILVFDVSGRQVDKLYDGNISAGSFEYTWNA